MEKTKGMKEREDKTGGEWEDEGEGFFSMVGQGVMGAVAYIALPKGHKDIGRNYDDLNPDVNGGLTYGEANIFGWDYAHAWNKGSPKEHIKVALDYFRKRN